MALNKEAVAQLAKLGMRVAANNEVVCDRCWEQPRSQRGVARWSVRPVKLEHRKPKTGHLSPQALEFFQRHAREVHGRG